MTNSTTTTTNPVNWFQVGASDADKAKVFYGELFGWTYAADENSEGRYWIVTCGDGAPIQGGIVDTRGEMPSHAIFCVQVPDVAAACERAEALGGSVLVPPQSMPGVTFADLSDVDGNRFGVYRPEPG
ncbi:MAG: VOC family protein [Acidimicrobiales bacterium]